MALTVSAPQAERVCIDPLSDAWVKARIGHLTASRMGDAISRKKDGTSSAKRRDYMMDLVAERMTDIATDHYVTDEMQWGLDHEDEAKRIYTEVTGRKIERCGFMAHPSIEFCGATPDGIVGNDGLVEVKCPTTRKHLSWLMAGEVPDEYLPQVLLQQAVYRRQWTDFISFDPRVVSARQRIMIVRLVPTPEAIEMIEREARAFLREVELMFNVVTTKDPVI